MTTTSRLIAASLLALAGATASSAFAAGPSKDYISPATQGTSVRTREAVVAETKNAITQHQLRLGGDVVEATPAPVLVLNDQHPLSRAEVKAAVAAARADHTLPRNGEM